MKKCQTCGADLFVTDTVCPNCKAPTASTQPSAVELPKMEPIEPIKVVPPVVPSPTIQPASSPSASVTQTPSVPNFNVPTSGSVAQSPIPSVAQNTIEDPLRPVVSASVPSTPQPTPIVSSAPNFNVPAGGSVGPSPTQPVSAPGAVSTNAGQFVAPSTPTVSPVPAEVTAPVAPTAFDFNVPAGGAQTLGTPQPAATPNTASVPSAAPVMPTVEEVVPKEKPKKSKGPLVTILLFILIAVVVAYIYFQTDIIKNLFSGKEPKQEETNNDDDINTPAELLGLYCEKSSTNEGVVESEKYTFNYVDDRVNKLTAVITAEAIDEANTGYFETQKLTASDLHSLLTEIEIEGISSSFVEELELKIFNLTFVMDFTKFADEENLFSDFTKYFNKNVDELQAELTTEGFVCHR